MTDFVKNPAVGMLLAIVLLAGAFSVSESAGTLAMLLILILASARLVNVHNTARKRTTKRKSTKKKRRH